jgi:hypothetical protein
MVKPIIYSNSLQTETINHNKILDPLYGYKCYLIQGGMRERVIVI